MIEDAGWKYIQVTKLDIGDEAEKRPLPEELPKGYRRLRANGPAHDAANYPAN